MITNLWTGIRNTWADMIRNLWTDMNGNPWRIVDMKRNLWQDTMILSFGIDEITCLGMILHLYVMFEMISLLSSDIKGAISVVYLRQWVRTEIPEYHCASVPARITSSALGTVTTPRSGRWAAGWMRWALWYARCWTGRWC